MLPGDEPPRSRADWPLAEVGRWRAWHNRGDGHGQKLRENGERLPQREDHRGVAKELDAAHTQSAAVGIVLRARNRQQRPHTSPVRSGIENTQE